MVHIKIKIFHTINKCPHKNKLSAETNYCPHKNVKFVHKAYLHIINIEIKIFIKMRA